MQNYQYVNVDQIRLQANSKLKKVFFLAQANQELNGTSSSYSAREDASNIMRVISLKNYCEGTRCVIQLLHYHNKVR